MSYKWRCKGEGDKLKFWLVLLFHKPSLFYNFHRCVGNNHEVVQASGVFCGGVVGGVGSGSDGLWGRGDVRTQLPMRFLDA